LHDHKGHNISIILWGRYSEVLSHSWQPPGHPAHLKTRTRWPFIPYFRRARVPHRVVLFDKRPVWSLWFRFPQIRRWGFWCSKGWMDADEFLKQKGDYYSAGISEMGKGCD
jgi:hypothetical protein